MKYTLPILLLVMIAGFLIFRTGQQVKVSPTEGISETGPYPSDWFFRQRAYPHGMINKEVYLRSVKEQTALRRQLESRNGTWESRGPVNVGGRITDLAVHPSDINTIYAGTASGGIFKTTDQGDNWKAIFDDQLSLAIGDMDIAPSDPDILYVGTGESNAGGGSLAYDGAGVFKTIDGGASWTHLGLESIGSVGKVEINPENPETAYVAAMGHLFANNEDRGVYRTQDGGQSWEKVLFLSDSTGAVDLAVHPTDTNIIFATMWERLRRPHRRDYGGPTSGIYRSMDGGDTWTKLTQGLPTSDLGRIGIAIFPSDPTVLYTVIADDIGHLKGVYKSRDGGDSWSPLGLGGFNAPSFMWWFGKIFIDPVDENKVYVSSLDVQRTVNGGITWFPVFHGAHVDQHAMYIHPDNPNFIIIGNDGGVYISEDGGETYEHFDNMPITQFYTCEIDPSDVNKLYGGTQDNGTIRTLSGNNNDWNMILGGDGFVCLVDPNDPNIIFAEFQYGGLRRSVNGGTSFIGVGWGISPSDIKNWKAPLAFNPHNSRSVYFGTTKLYKTTNQANWWDPISPVITTPPAGSNLIYGTLTTIAVSPVDTNIIYIGTDDGKVYHTANEGNDWNFVSGSLPDRWITQVVAHPDEADIAYVTLSGYRYDEYLAHVFKTNDQGNTWTDISSNLPEVPVNDLLIDPDNTDQLYVATDVGVFVSYDDGGFWEPFGEGIPNVPVLDLCLHAESGILAAATYGRSMFTIDLNVVDVDPQPSPVTKAVVFPNPFSAQTTLALELARQENVEIRVFDAGGKLVQHLNKGILNSGEHRFRLDLSPLSKGIYIANITTGEKS